jgi:hypothetical protein
MEHCVCIPESNDDLELIIKIVSLVLSLSAIIFTYVSVLLQKKHNRNAVKPIANISISDYENKVAVEIQNNGTGPLIIKSFRAYTDQENKNNLIDLMPDLPPGIVWTTFFSNLTGFAITPSKTLNLLELSVDHKSIKESNVRDDIRRKLALITVELVYEDIYGKEMPIKERSLDWFGRHFK